MAPNFSHLLKRPAGKAKKPEALPTGLYPGVIKSFEIDDKNKNKTPYVRFHLGLTGWPDSISEDERFQSDGNGGRIAIDLAKRQPRRDYFLTEDALYRLDELLRSLNISLDGRDYESAVPDAIGAAVTVDLKQYLNERNNEVGNQVDGLTSAA